MYVLVQPLSLTSDDVCIHQCTEMSAGVYRCYIASTFAPFSLNRHNSVRKYYREFHVDVFAFSVDGNDARCQNPGIASIII